MNKRIVSNEVILKAYDKFKKRYKKVLETLKDK